MSEDHACLGASKRRARLRVLGSFELHTAVGADAIPTLAADERRVLAALAVAATPRSARSLATSLWPELTHDIALGTLLGVRDSLGELLVEAEGTLRLADWIEVDLARALALLREWERDPFGLRLDALGELVDALGRELLPGWSDPWAVHERERYHHVRLHALESACSRLTALGRHELAIKAGIAVVRAEPLREEARRALIEAHLAAGNVSEAVHQYEEFVEICARLGIMPSADLSTFFPPSPAWPVLTVRRPVHLAPAMGRGMLFDPHARRVQTGAGATRG
jgi:DNA-binding SARP family transcriptional activator